MYIKVVSGQVVNTSLLKSKKKKGYSKKSKGIMQAETFQ